MRAASAGKGVDRHLLGLYSMIRSQDEQRQAKIFNDPSYALSKHFRLSTSNLSLSDKFWAGFGPVVPDGYGINYNICKDSIKFSISSSRICPGTDSKQFRESIRGALRDMK